MKTDESANIYARLLEKQGNYIVSEDGVDWFEYCGFMMPAYLPHCIPDILEKTAHKVLKISGKSFVRWDSCFGQVEKSEWWYILKKEKWDIDEVKDKKKRWMIRQGKKNFTVRPLTSTEVIEMCSDVVMSLEDNRKIEFQKAKNIFQNKCDAANQIPGVLEYSGCFSGERLVGFSENYIQGNAVFMMYMQMNPAFMKDYISYAMIDGILEYYLNQKKFSYVLDGSRCIHHRTNIQDLLMKVFGFRQEYAILHVLYSKKLAFGIKIAWPFRNIIWAVWKKWTFPFLDNVSAILRQEAIRRSCCKSNQI